MVQKSPPVIHISTFYMILSNTMSLKSLYGLADSGLVTHYCGAQVLANQRRQPWPGLAR